MPKLVKFDAWEGRWAGRGNPGEMRHRIEAYPADTDDTTMFTIESCHCYSRHEVSFTLFGKLIGHPEHALCRYDVHIGGHGNPKWFPPPYIGSRIQHRHVYSERALREGYTWSKCGEIIGPKSDGIQHAIDRLTPLFLQQLNIEIHDPDVRAGLFGR